MFNSYKVSALTLLRVCAPKTYMDAYCFVFFVST